MCLVVCEPVLLLLKFLWLIRKGVYTKRTGQLTELSGGLEVFLRRSIHSHVAELCCHHGHQALVLQFAMLLLRRGTYFSKQLPSAPVALLHQEFHLSATATAPNPLYHLSQKIDSRWCWHSYIAYFQRKVSGRFGG